MYRIDVCIVNIVLPQHEGSDHFMQAIHYKQLLFLG